MILTKWRIIYNNEITMMQATHNLFTFFFIICFASMTLSSIIGAVNIDGFN